MCVESWLICILPKVSRVRPDDIPTAEKHIQNLLRLIKDSPERVDVYDMVDRVNADMKGLPNIVLSLTAFSSNSTS